MIYAGNKMEFEVIHVDTCNIVEGWTKSTKYKIHSNNVVVCVVVDEEDNNIPLIYDDEYDDFIMCHKWKFYESTGYFSGGGRFLHRHIAEFAGFEGLNDKQLSVDHINWQKNDNRRRNLRMATQSEQNANRCTRRDKLSPHQSLKDIGIDALPRHVRWDNSERKFIIEKHPVLRKQKEEGERKKAVMSGTKQQHLSVVEKYNDILERLQHLDSMLEANDIEFAQHRDELKQEYQYIVKAVTQYCTMNSV